MEGTLVHEPQPLSHRAFARLGPHSRSWRGLSAHICQTGVSQFFRLATQGICETGSEFSEG